MTTWICKSAVAAAMMMLGACDEITDVSATAPDAAPLRQAAMLSGKVMLVPPLGYCIDAASLKQRFALMARCDALVDGAGTGGAPLGIITASVTPLRADDALPSVQDVATAGDLENPRDVSQSDSYITFRAEGPSPDAGYGKTQWHSVARIGAASVGLAMYGPPKGRAITGEGRDMLTNVIANSRRQTKKPGS